MSKRDLGLLAYLGYKAVKNEPSKIGKELGECLIGWVIAMIFMGIIYVLFTLILEGPALITNNIEIVTIIMGIVMVIIVSYLIYYGITNYLEKKKQRQEKIKLEKIKREKIKQDKIKQENALKIKKQKRKQNIRTYNPSTSKYIVCMECGYENPKNLSKCWDCGADLTKQKIANIKKSANTFLNSEYENKTPRQDSYKKSKYGRCPECNSLVILQDGRGRCRFCGFYINK